MSAAALLERAQAAGLTVRLASGKVALSGPATLVTEWAAALRPHRRELAAELHAAWRARDRAYLQHHWKCPTCIAASQGRGLRCGVGASLWTNYEREAS